MGVHWKISIFFFGGGGGGGVAFTKHEYIGCNCLKRGVWTICRLKGNPNIQSILDWILQVLHYYCRKQHKSIENSQIIEQNLVLSLPFSLFTATCASCRLPQWQSFFISWTQYSAMFKCYKWSFVPYIVSCSALKMVFFKLSQLDITACMKNCVYNNFNLRCYFISSIIECLYRSISFINSSIQI